MDARQLHDRLVGGLLGLVGGDALGVPVEFRSRQYLKAKPITSLIGHGTHDQPPGTWSDDSSLALATAESLLTGYDPADMMARFSRWLNEGYMTPHGEVFDVGGTTAAAIGRYDRKLPADQWGGQKETDNGNGSLMRILSLSLYVHSLDPATIIERSGQISALTHAHARSRLCCAYYSLLVKGLLEGLDLRSAMSFAADLLRPVVPASEQAPLASILTGGVLDRPEEDIRSGGYVVDTLEASLWCVGCRIEIVMSALIEIEMSASLF